MKHALLVSGLLVFFILGCAQSSTSPVVLEELESDVLREDQASLAKEAESRAEIDFYLTESQLQKAAAAFLAKGVPSVALERAFSFFRENRAVGGGLKDSSCLIKPMSETGEIPINSNRYDPTTLQMLKQGIRNERYMMIVDFTQSNTQARGYLLDLKPKTNGDYNLTRLMISHGYGSQAKNGVPQVFTNASGLGTTLSGFFVTGTVTYPYFGNLSSGSYSSTGLRLYGLESINNTAEKTSKVTHGAPYVSPERAGNSAGCPAMTLANAKTVIPQLTGGILWYHHTRVTNSLSYKAPSCQKALLTQVQEEP